MSQSKKKRSVRRKPRVSTPAPLFGKTELAEFKRRRRALMRIMGDEGVAVIPAARVAVRNRDSEYAYRQDSSFDYLSGFGEPEALLVLVPGRRTSSCIVFCRERDELREIWHGRRVGVEDAPVLLGVDDAFPITDVDEILPGLLEGRQHVYHTLGKDAEFDARLLGWLRQSRRSRSGHADPDTFISLDHHLHEMRLIKSRHELGLLRRAAAITAAGHNRALAVCQPGLHEYELEAEIVAEYTRQRATHAFLPIVAGGENACILHYTENDRPLVDGDLVLIDSGAEFRGYAGDITRTYPVNGRFSSEQRAVYEIVLEAQLAAIKANRPGNHWNDPHAAAVRVLTRGLKELGILKGRSLSKLIKDEAYKPYYMHKTGHWLGRDVHDVGEYKIDDTWRLLEPGMVVTVEPGLYLGPSTKVAPRWRNIGVRIEDDVIIGADGPEVMTEAVPKHVEALEGRVGVVA